MTTEYLFEFKLDIAFGEAKMPPPTDFLCTIEMAPTRIGERVRRSLPYSLFNTEPFAKFLLGDSVLVTG